MRLPFVLRWWHGLVFTLVIAAIGGGVYWTVGVNATPSALLSPLPSPSESVETTTEVPSALPSPAPLSTDSPPTSLTFLLLGYGGAGHAGGFLSDAIALARFDLVKKQLTLISVPRDLWVELPTGRQAKINAAFASFGKTQQYPREDAGATEAYAGASVSEQVVRTVTGIKPDYYIAVDFRSFEQLVDALGGIEVQVSHAFDDSFYPVVGRELELCGKTPEEVTQLSNTLSGFELEKQFPCRYERVQYDVGPARMNGAAALKFVRSRHSAVNGSDFSRGERQREVLEAMRQKLLSIQVFSNLKKLYGSLSTLVHTDVNWQIVQSAATILADISSYSVVHVGLTNDTVLQSGTGSGGQSVLIPKSGMHQWTGVRAYIQEKL